MPEVKLQFVRQADLASDMIAWFSQGSLSHVDACIGGGLLGARNDTYHDPIGLKSCDIGPGVYLRPADYKKWALRVIFTIPCTEDQQTRWLKWLLLQQGKPYDKTAIWGFVFDRNWREEDSWICSELQAEALEQAGICRPLYLASNKITPVMLAQTVSALPGVTHVTYAEGRGRSLAKGGA